MAQFSPADIQVAMGMPNDEAVAYLKSKGYAITFSWSEAVTRARQRAFTVAKMLSLDLLRDVHTAVVTAIETGETGESFAKKLEPMLKARGWWGKQQVTDPKTGQVKTVTTGAPWRVALIYRQNLQNAYMAARRIEQKKVQKQFPFIQYLVASDKRTTDTCEKLRNKVVRADGTKLYHPFHFGCRTRAVSLNQQQVERMGLSVVKVEDLGVTPAPGFEDPPEEIRMPDLAGYPPAMAEAFRKEMEGGPRA